MQPGKLGQKVFQTVGTEEYDSFRELKSSVWMDHSIGMRGKKWGQGVHVEPWPLEDAWTLSWESTGWLKRLSHTVSGWVMWWDSDSGKSHQVPFQGMNWVGQSSDLRLKSSSGCGWCWQKVWTKPGEWAGKETGGHIWEVDEPGLSNDGMWGEREKRKHQREDPDFDLAS